MFSNIRFMSLTMGKREKRVKGIEPSFRYQPSGNSLGRMRTDVGRNPRTILDVMSLIMTKWHPFIKTHVVNHRFGIAPIACQTDNERSDQPSLPTVRRPRNFADDSNTLRMNPR